jgi:hypothetical protein
VSENSGASLADHLAGVLAELEGVERTATADGDELRVGDRLIAVLAWDRLDVVLDAAVADAAQRTPNVTAGSRGSGWVTFQPPVLDRFALDRAEAWLRLAHRGASARR